MNKKYAFIFLMFIFLVCPNLRVNAMKPWDIPSVVECSNIELAIAKEDGSLEKAECYDDYNAALSAMFNSSSDGAILIKDGVIINAKYGLVDYDADFTNAGTKYVRVYKSSTSGTEIGYIRTAPCSFNNEKLFCGDDAVLLDYDINTKRVKIKVSGLTGWINKNDNSATVYDIVPLAWVKSPQSYQVTNETIYHNFPANVYGEKGTYSMSIDIKPDVLSTGTYYSYDGHYFYDNLKTLINDYRNDNYNNSVNKDNPYFNYYQYLPFRTKTGYSATNINDFLSKRVSSTSKLLNTGEAFTYAQENYGVNAALMLSIGRNESGGGTSTFARERNNLFGLNAVDANPGEASSYATVEDCILDYGYRWMSYWYLQPGDSHYRGGNLGNKYEGLNLKYASDPFWGETAAHLYYDLDKSFGFQDRDKNIAVLNSDYDGVVYAKKAPNGENIRIYDSNEFYQYKIYGTAISIISEVTDENGVLWYKIQSDPVLDGNSNYIGDSKSNPRINYNWNTYVYVEAKYFYRVNTSTIPQEQSSSGSSEPTVKQVSSVVNESHYSYDKGFILGVEIGLEPSSLIDSMTRHGGSNVTITDMNGNAKSGKLATGDKITITSGDRTETIEIVVSGDTDGDGSMSAMDYVNIKNHIMESHSLGGAYLKAADVDNDGSISAIDYVKVKNYIMSQ